MSRPSKVQIQTVVLACLVVILFFLFSDLYEKRHELKAKYDFTKKAGQTKEPVTEETILKRLVAPEEYRLSVFASGLPNARFMKVTDQGDILISTPSSGRIMLIEKDENNDGRSDGIRILVSDLNKPHGLDIHDRFLYVAETDSVGRISFDSVKRTVSGSYEKLITGIPAGGHWTRTLRFGPDGKMYLSIGSSCNVCIEKDQRRAAIVRYNSDGSGEEIFASGLRNSVGFDWNPADGQIYATDNGRDLLGDDFPPCELNRIVKNGFYGWPYLNGNNIPDPDFGKGNEDRISTSIKPVHSFRAHNAPLGITFLKSPETPGKYSSSALAALHGSWNRSRKDGYKVVSLHWDEKGNIHEKDFLTGFLRSSDDNVIGRPVDVAEDIKGNVYVSDDFAGLVYMLRPALKASSNSISEISPEKLWQTHSCSTCHDRNSDIQGMITKQLAGLSKKYSKDTLQAFLKTPTPPMPANSMSENEIRSLSLYLLSIYP